MPKLAARNPQDVTLRNIRAARKEIVELKRRVRTLEKAVVVIGRKVR